jgi:hypothetical protein
MMNFTILYVQKLIGNAYSLNLKLNYAMIIATKTCLIRFKYITISTSVLV